MTFWVGRLFFLKDPEMEKGIRARRIGSPENNKNLFAHWTRVHDF
jgi:hypothetical protein